MDGTITIGTLVATKNFDAQIKYIENKMLDIEDKLKQADMGFEVGDTQKLEAEYERLGNQLIGLKQKQEKYNQSLEQISNVNLLNIESRLNNIGNSIQKVTKKVVKWGLATFGIRSAYSAIRQAMSLVEAKNENISGQINIMKMAVANTLMPVVQKIINLVAKLMMYINYIYNKLTGKNLFNFQKAFADANKNSAQTVKNISKMTAGFDEMNVLQDASAAASGGNVVGAVENPFKDWENFKPPKWLEDLTDLLDQIKRNWKVIVGGILAIGAAFLIFKLIKGKDITELSTSFTGFFNSLGTGIEAIAILGGLALVIEAVTHMITAFSESNLKVTDVLGLMGTVIGSITTLIIALTLAAQFLQSPLAMGGLAVLAAAIVAILFTMAATLPKILDALGTFIVKIGPTLNSILDTIGRNISKIIYTLGVSLPPVINSVGNLFQTVFNGIAKVIDTVGGTIVKILNTAKSLVVTVLNSILNFINRLGPAINRFVDDVIKAVTKLINFMVSGIEFLVNTIVVDGVNTIIRGINSIGKYIGFTIPIIPDYRMRRFVPRLAKGGIVNMPSRGVPVGSAIAGERGAEGVIPLTDSQQMALLGEAIGKYININATIPVYVGNRQIARELRKIDAEDNFAFNR